MAYLLNKTVFLDDFVERDGSVEFHARASIGEINSILGSIYGVGPTFLERKYNYSAYMFGDIAVTYIHNGTVYTRIKSRKKGILRNLSEKVQDLN